MGPRKKFIWDDKLRSVSLFLSFFLSFFLLFTLRLTLSVCLHPSFSDVCVCVSLSPSRLLLCTLVRVKLGCYELEGQSSVSPEDYLKAFMEAEVKPLWPKGWMQARYPHANSLTCRNSNSMGYSEPLLWS